MASLSEIRSRIRSIKNTSKITHAMELVSAAKMKRSQGQAIAGKPYSQLVNEVIRRIAGRVHPERHPLLARSQGENGLVIVLSTDRGLIGSLNSNIFKEVEKLSPTLKFLTLGKKARNFVIKSNRELIADFPLPERAEISDIRPVVKTAIQDFLSRKFDQVYVVYTHFQSTLKQEAVTKILLPITTENVLEDLAENQTEIYDDLLFEPDPDVVLESILPGYVLDELYQIMLEAKASEHSSRMVAMKNATENAEDLVGDLTLTYNGIRQDAITKEILDISTAAVALE